MKEILKELFNKYKIGYSLEQLQKLEQFYEIVVEENKKFNLTAITEKNDFCIKHILDCAIPGVLLPQNSKVIDVGAGAGFPSVVLKILRPDLNITMLDSLNKRVNFLNDTVNKLQLQCIMAHHDRAEDYAIKHREEYDVAIARAVAGLDTLSEYCIPFVKVGGLFIAMKGSAYKEELNQAKNAIEVLGGALQEVKLTTIDEIQSERANIVIKKAKSTPTKYPRGKNLPRLKPIQ